MPRITLFNAMSNYDLVRSFTDQWRYAFHQLGCECQVIDAARNPSAADCQKLIERWGPHLLFGFNAGGFGIRHADGQFLPKPGYPYFNYMIDSPMYHTHWVPFIRAPHVHTGLCDPTHRHAAHYLGIPDERLVEVRHGGHPSPLARDSERTTELLVLGTLLDPDLIVRSLRAQLPPGVFRIFEFVAETWSANLELGLYDVFDSVVRDMAVELSEADRITLSLIICGNVDRYIRNRERLRVLRAFGDLPIRVFGIGWDQLALGGRVSIGPELSYDQAHEEICRAKILINLQPIAIHATTERPLGALLNGAVLVTTVNHFLSRHFVEGEQFIPFRSEAEGIAQARGQIEELLAQPARRIAIYESARETALAGHTWKHRAAEVLEQCAGIA